MAAVARISAKVLKSNLSLPRAFRLAKVTAMALSSLPLATGAVKAGQGGDVVGRCVKGDGGEIIGVRTIRTELDVFQQPSTRGGAVGDP